MERLERLLFPIFLLVAVLAALLVKAGPERVLAISRVFGIVLIVLIVMGMVARGIVKVRRARRAEAAPRREALRREALEDGEPTEEV